MAKLKASKNSNPFQAKRFKEKSYTVALPACNISCACVQTALMENYSANNWSDLFAVNAIKLVYFLKFADLYTFDADAASAEQTYNEVCDAYSRLLTRLGLPYVRGNSCLFALSFNKTLCDDVLSFSQSLLLADLNCHTGIELFSVLGATNTDVSSS